jgi:ferrous iron transport protein B
MRLSSLPTGASAVVVKILGHGAFRKRVMEMGFVKGQTIKVLLHAPLKDPIKYSIMGYEVSLRTSEADLIEVVGLDDIENIDKLNSSNEYQSVSEMTDVVEPDERVKRIVDSERRNINVALIGNPNCGKTSLFNIASGAREHVGNYSGVTVDAKSGKFKYGGYTFNIVDLPGTYSLTTYSPEELYVRRFLHDSTPDVIINVVDVSNLERNLYLTTQLIDMDRSMVIALNMYDELRNSGATLQYETLGEMIGVPMLPVVSKSGEGIEALFDAVISVYEEKHSSVRHIHIKLGTDIEDAVRVLIDMIKSDDSIDRHFSPRYIAIKLLEGDSEIEENISKSPNCSAILAKRNELRTRIEQLRDEDITTSVANEKYGFIAGALAETLTAAKRPANVSTRLIDSLVTSQWLGFPIFFIIMFVIFWATFAIGQYPMDWIDIGVGLLGEFVQNHMTDGPLKDMIIDGIIGGVGGVIVFLPNILILYFCISFMEDSGYMARAAFIMDKVMHRIGLHGKSFIPLVMGFGCNVPAVLSSRSIESRSSRIITILINPFMSCSARLPIYILIVGTFFRTNAALVFMGLYLLGIVIAIITAKLLRKFMFKRDETPFVMELPPYRLPTMKASLRHTWAKGEQYLRKMGGIILFASIVVWAFNYFPLNREERPTDDTVMVDDSAIDMEHDSYLEMAGKVINPIMQPLGFHWRASVAALAGVPAKEIVVSTLGVLYTHDEDVSDRRLGARLAAPSVTTGKPDFTGASALSFMVFILLYCPCVATVTAIARETGSWKYSLFSISYNTVVAWIASFVTYHIALLF